MCGPIIEVDVVDFKEENLWIKLANSTCPTEENHFLHPAILVHISRRRVVDYPVTWEVPVMILSVILCLVNDHKWNKELSIISGEDQSITPEVGYLSCLRFTNIFPREELVGTDHSKP